MDPNQRYYYDRHGYPELELRHGVHPILMKLGEIVVHTGNYNFTKFHLNWIKNKKVLLIARFSFQNFKVSVEL